ncbi:hypothetical protein MYX77_03345 [Acidobacteriia bacterium AH_259_A11_L15]|nr:hypothetical protein [Acidobacteriia bacterium AH_259_A11_L15]
MLLLGAGFFFSKATYTVTVKNSFSPVPVRVFADGQPLGIDHQQGGTVSLGKRRIEMWMKKYPRFTAQVLSPCGDWKEDVDLIRQTFTPPLYMDAVADRETTLALWIDNREGPHAKLALGQLALEIPAQWSGEWRIPIPDCGGDIAVLLNEERVGTLPTQQQLSQTPAMVPAFLVDVSGRHCYRFREINYTTETFSRETPREERLRGRRYYQLPSSVDYFLTPAPGSIRLPFDNLSARKHELTDCQ